MARRRTFAQARADILDRLRQKQWTVKANLKIPHATSPDGDVRLWFKPQAVHFTCGVSHQAGDARTIMYDLDIRKVDPDKLITYAVTRLCKR